MVSNHRSPRINRWYIVSRREQYDRVDMAEHKIVWHDNETAAGLSAKRGYDSFDFGIATGARCDRLHVRRSDRRLEIAEVIGPTPWRRIRIEQYGDAFQAGGDLREQLKHLGSNCGF